MKLQDFSTVQSIPGYTTILRVVLKAQIQLLAEQLFQQTGEESLILTVSTAEGTLCHLGSDTGQTFIQDKEEVKSQFLAHCIKEKGLSTDSSKSNYPLYYRNFDSVSKQDQSSVPRSQKRKAGCTGSPSQSPAHPQQVNKFQAAAGDITQQETVAKRFCANNFGEEKVGITDVSLQSIDSFDKNALCDNSKATLVADSKDKVKKTLSSKIEEITERRKKDETQKVDNGQFLCSQVAQCQIPLTINQPHKVTPPSHAADINRESEIHNVVNEECKQASLLNQAVATDTLPIPQVAHILNGSAAQQSDCSPVLTNQISPGNMPHAQISNSMSTPCPQAQEQPVATSEIPESPSPGSDYSVFRLKDVSRASHRKPKLPRFNIGVASDDEDNDLSANKTDVAGAATASVGSDLLDISVNLVDTDHSFHQISLDELGDGVLLKENVTDIPILAYYNGEESMKPANDSVTGGKTKDKLKRSYYKSSSVIVSGSCSEKNWIKCSMCPEKFPTPDDLSDHLKRIVHTPKKFHCDLCGRMFSQLRDMERHRRIHTGERPFTCDVCGKAFARKDNLKSHKVKHYKHQLKMVEQTA